LLTINLRYIKKSFVRNILISHEGLKVRFNIGIICISGTKNKNDMNEIVMMLGSLLGTEVFCHSVIGVHPNLQEKQS